MFKKCKCDKSLKPQNRNVKEFGKYRLVETFITIAKDNTGKELSWVSNLVLEEKVLDSLNGYSWSKLYSEDWNSSSYYSLHGSDIMFKVLRECFIGEGK